MTGATGFTRGSRLGPYEIVAPLGSSGTGDAYRARDTRLGHEVAIKVLPPHFILTSEARARFERVARLVSQLNHPNICTLHEVGREGESDYLVMELINGVSLGERLLTREALPLDEVLSVGIEIADALDAAHARGIIQQGLNPECVVITEEGHAKVADFGLAAVAGAGARSLPFGAYASPEQIRGGEVDARSDLFSLGAMLYEMATGHRAFEGSSPAAVSEGILSRTPGEASRLRRELPEELDRILGKALEKDRELRYQTAAEIRSDLARLKRDLDSGRIAGGPRVAGRGSRHGDDAPAPSTAWARFRLARVGRIAAGVLVVAALVLVANRVIRREPMREPVHLTIDAPPGLAAAMESPRISPDGRLLAFIGTDSAGVRRIYVRPMDRSAARAIPETEGAGRPFWSPDSRFLGFVSGGKLRKVEVAGGQPVMISEGAFGDGSWGRTGTILLDAGGAPGDVIQAVSAAGGVATQATWIDASRDETAHAWPCFLPDGRHFLYLAYVKDKPDSTLLRVGLLGSRESRVLSVGSFKAVERVEYTPPGYLLYLRGRTLFAQPFDSRRLRITGGAFPVVDDARAADQRFNNEFSSSASGTLVYQKQVFSGDRLRLEWVDRSGNRLGTVGPPVADYWTGWRLALSPDGERVAVPIAAPGEAQTDLWIIDIARDVMTRVTSDSLAEFNVVWSPDGGTIYFQRGHYAGDRGGMWQKSSSGLGPERLVGNPPLAAWPTDISHDGHLLLAGTVVPGAKRNWDIVAVSLGPDGKTTPLIASPSVEGCAIFSPDEKWIAYTSEETGRSEVYVVDYPGLKNRWRISTEGGIRPRWSRDGRELYFQTYEASLRVVDIRTTPSFRAGKPSPILESIPELWLYAPAPDGQRFLILVPAKGQGLPPFQVVLNWSAAIRRR